MAQRERNRSVISQGTARARPGPDQMIPEESWEWDVPTLAVTLALVAGLSLAAGVGLAPRPIAPLVPASAPVVVDGTPAAGRPPLESVRSAELTSIPIAGAGPLAWDRASGTLVVGCAGGVALVILPDDLSRIGAPSVRIIDVAARAIPTGGGVVTSLATDPAGRAFAAATIAPPFPAHEPGAVVFFSLPWGEPTLAARCGLGPIDCAFALDGSTMAVLESGAPGPEPWGGQRDPAPGLTTIDLAGVGTSDDLARMTSHRVRQHPIDAGGAGLFDLMNPGPGRGTIVIDPALRSMPGRDLQPSSLALAGGRAFVCMPRNAAVLSMDVASGRVVTLAPLSAGPGPRAAQAGVFTRGEGVRLVLSGASTPAVLDGVHLRDVSPREPAPPGEPGASCPLVLGVLRGRPVALLGVSQPSGLAVFDLTDESAPRLLGIQPMATPESGASDTTGPSALCLIPRPIVGDSELLVAASFESSGHVRLLRLAPGP